jgi:hypothetical protein
VPSLHDAKSAAIIARLHADGLSTRLPAEVPERRQLKAALAIMDLHQERYLQLVHRLESWLARHWPELPTLLDLTSSSLMALLARVGGPADVAAAPEQVDKTPLSVWGGPGLDSRISPPPRSRIVQESIAIEPVVLPNKPLQTLARRR